MDHDKLVKEVQRLQDWLSNHDETDADYDDVLARLIKLTKLGMEFDDICDKQLERQDRLEIERDKMERELELKEKEVQLKYEIEARKIDENVAEVKARKRNERFQAVWDVIKIGGVTVCSIISIVVTGKIEQSVIIGQHKWALIPKIGKF